MSSPVSRASFETTNTTSTYDTILKDNTTATVSATPKPSLASKTWSAIKKAAKEHHESVNGAYATYYGQNQGKY
ncbi:hypothetical protein BU24DRAFT_421706 [Aaosphaeria arxii CBS 175.79]|uniref:Uncharacterized protein n=1 Tax=Aaosphaeria arxii CBS 175.79 TaxID=1450172 RepID=A0A6A5XRE6_9PLEO|nr:uncharacterized protein BU24DRAFT_421706 [Aaosphaeria arxii CBS 175.79]KAF2015407.1 hypothetical protein BU24DRAFT_421706 [Aaosphaeria arxii CBS 175.79]